MRILAIAKRIIQQFRRDKRSLALIFIAPIAVLWLFSIILTSGETNTHIGIVQLPTPMIHLFDQEDIIYEKINSINEAEHQLRNGKIDAYVYYNHNQLTIKLEGSDLPVNQEVIKEVQNALKQNNSAQKLTIEYLYGTDQLSVFDTTGPVFLGFFAFFFVFILSAVSFVRERLTGTLERILVSPVRKIEIVLGYVLGFSVFAFLQSILITFFTVQLLEMYNVGQLIYVIIVTCLISLTALTLGTFLSAFAHNEFQVLQFIPLVVVPQIFFSGMFSVDNLPTWLLTLGKLFPLTYGAKILRNIMFKGENLVQNSGSILILIGFSLVFIILNMVILNKQRSV